MSLLLAPRYWGAHLLMVAAVAVAAALGVWQLDVWDAARTAEAKNLSRAEPIPLSKAMGGDDPFPGQHLGQPVTFEGEWLPGGTVYVQDRTMDGKRGYWVVTPVLVGESAMPVVRGWSPSPEAQKPNGPVQVEGWLQASEGARINDPDPHDDVVPEMRIASLVEQVDADLYSGYVVARDVAGETADLVAVPPEAVPEVSGSTSLRNLLYGFQWWIFGGFAVYIWVRWCRDVIEASRAPSAQTEQVASPS